MLTVELNGNTELRRALRRFAPDLDKNLTAEMRSGLKPVVQAARSFVPSQSPMRNWEGGKSKKINAKTSMFRIGKFPLFNPTIIKSGITYSTSVSRANKKGFTSMARIMNMSAVGAIYETAGRKNPQGQPWVGSKDKTKSKKVSHSVNPRAGAQFISNLPPLTSSLQGQGRLIYRAWAEDLGRAHNIINRAVDKTIKEFKARAETSSFERAA